MYYSDDFDKYFNDLEDVSEYVECNCVEPYPDYILLNPCKKVFGHLISIEYLLQECFEAYTPRTSFLELMLELIQTTYVEDLFCDDYDIDWELKGLRELKQGLKEFLQINFDRWRSISHLEEFDIVKDSVGIGFLQNALTRFDLQNKHVFLYYPDRSKPVIKVEVDLSK